MGTRPEAIKCASTIRALGKSCHLIAVTQHRELLTSHLQEQCLVPDQWIEVDRATGSLTEFVGNAIKELGSGRVGWGSYAYAVVQGDTATAFAAAQAAFLSGTRVAHIEAGLRAPTVFAPFPEEMNRRAISKIATLHFAPTQAAARNLRNERVEGVIHVTGNTGIDAFRAALEHTTSSAVTDIVEYAAGRPIILITCHRREAWDSVMPKLVALVADLPRNYVAVWPAHANPKLKDMMRAAALPPHVILPGPLEHTVMAQLLDYSSLVITDSGGLIEEAADAEKPCLILRRETERPEALDSACRLIGDQVDDLLRMIPIAVKCRRKSRGRFGDGGAGSRIAEILLQQA